MSKTFKDKNKHDHIKVGKKTKKEAYKKRRQKKDRITPEW
jgi:hypothetical protein